MKIPDVEVLFYNKYVTIVCLIPDEHVVNNSVCFITNPKAGGIKLK
jgi:hypothetical protein